MSTIVCPPHRGFTKSVDRGKVFRESLMSDTIWLEISGGIEKTGGDRDNSMMLKLCADLDALADKLGVPKLSSFFDDSALVDEYAEELEDVDVDIPPADPVWFDAGAGSQVVGALLSALRDGSAERGTKLDASRADWRAMLLEELEYCHGALKEAAQRSQRFRFLVVP